ncbi:MAG: transcriptional regulator [Actinomycetales bacterium]|nr:MAG: transcriptional regulator [Actinomycetales bacterium]
MAGPREVPDPAPVHLDGARLKALAHPLRSRLLVALRHGGPATATELAAALGTNSGATSYHLRQLAAVALVHDTGTGTGRERRWAAATAYTSWRPSDLATDPDAESAWGWLTRDYLRHFDQRFEHWLDIEASWPARWRDTVGMSDEVVIATAEHVAAMTAELHQVIDRYRRVGQGNPLARRVAVYTATYPVDLDRPPLSSRPDTHRELSAVRDARTESDEIS